MNRYLSIALFVVLLLFVSYIYKFNSINIFESFPKELIMEVENSLNSPFLLILFFSKETCSPCMEIVETLNRLDNPYIVYGVVPDEDLVFVDLIRNQYGIEFKIVGIKNKKRFRPLFNPTLMGVSKSRKVLFAIPGISGMNAFLDSFLKEFYRKAQQPFLIQ